MVNCKRLIGDCRESKLYDVHFKYDSEAQEIADIICTHATTLPNFNGSKPQVVLVDKDTKRQAGYCDTKRMRIVLNHQNWGVLAHELAHFAKGSRVHDAIYREANAEIFELMEAML